MLEHLTNCHGEWNAVIAAASSIPFIGVWIRLKISELNHKDNKTGKANENR